MIKMNLVAGIVGMFVIGTSAAFAQTAPTAKSDNSMAGMNMPMAKASPPAAPAPMAMKPKMKKHKKKAKIAKSTETKPMSGMSKDNSMPMKP